MSNTWRLTVIAPVAAMLALAGCGSSKSSTSSSSSSSSSAAVAGGGSGACAQLAAASSPTGPTAGSPNIQAILKLAVLHPPRAFAFTQRSCVGPGANAVQSSTSATMQLHPTLKAALTVQTQQGSLPERLVGNTIYVNLPNIASRDGGRPWVAVSLAAAGNQAGLNLQELLSELRSADPNRSLMLLKNIKGFAPIGAVTVNGQHVFGYHATVTPQQLSSPVLSPDLVRQLKATMARVGATSEMVTLYLTSAGNLVRAVTRLNSTTHGPIVTVQDTHTLPNAVNVAPPPAGQTISLAALRRVGGAA